MFKLRPILNVLKKTLGAYLNVGSEVTLDKSSIACRSTYGRLLIFYNNTKPSGKYHFHIYVVCDADNYAALRFCVHTKDGSDFADGGVETRTASTEVQFLDEEANNENNHNHTDKEENGSTIQNLVLDMMKPFFMLGKVMNCDNYYTSSETFIKLQKKGVFARGTCHPSRKMFPLCVQYTRSEAKHSEHGSMKVATNEDHQLVVMGWVDGNPVNFLTNADGTSTKDVCRCVQSPCLQHQKQFQGTTMECKVSTVLISTLLCFQWRGDTASKSSTTS